MKTLKYISGFLGAALLIYWLMGIFFDYYVNLYLFLAGLVLFGLVFLPLSMLDKQRRKNSWEYIKEEENPKHKKTKRKGYSFEQSPYRKKHSSLRWEGGSVYGANPKRGGRRSFLRSK